jgi:hypothetical protein
VVTPVFRVVPAVYVIIGNDTQGYKGQEPQEQVGGNTCKYASFTHGKRGKRNAEREYEIKKDPFEKGLAIVPGKSQNQGSENGEYDASEDGKKKGFCRGVPEGEQQERKDQSRVKEHTEEKWEVSRRPPVLAFQNIVDAVGRMK